MQITDPTLLDRREMLARIMFVAGASAIGAVGHDALAKASTKSAGYLDKPVFDLLSAVSDTIVPQTETVGAVAVRVPALFEALLVNWASGERRVELTQALARIDRKARDQTGKGFASLSAAARHDLLAAHDAQALKVRPGPRTGNAVSLMAGPNFADAGYGKLKELIVLLFYMSEPALTQELNYVHVPGEWQASVPIGPDTRPSAGTMF